MADAQLSVELTAKVQAFIDGFKKAVGASENAEDKISKATSGISRAVTSNIAGVFSIAAITTFGKAVLDVTAEFQKFQAVLGNTLGSSALANLKLREIQDFASKTPFAVNELTGAFVKLANSGFKPTGDEMRKLGDLASSTGKSFDQLAEAILDAQSGEFERLKEFGIRAKDAGDSVIFTYKGVQTQVDKTSESIRNYITSLGDAEGVSGSMAKISETLGGKISNLGDSWDQMLLSVGGNTQGVFNSAIDIISRTINNITEYNKQLDRVSKYKLGSNTAEFFRGINRAINPFADRITDIEKANYSISQIEKSTSSFVSKTVSGAKSVNDFGKALAALKRDSDNARSAIGPPTLIGGRDNSSAVTLFKKEQNAIQRVYQDAINAVIDARKNFGKELNAPDSNFGKGKKDKTAKEKASVLGLPDNPKEIIAQYFREVSAANAPGALKIKAPEKIEIDGKKADLQIGELINIVGLTEIIRDLKIAEEFNKEASKILTSGVIEGFSAIGQAIGDAVVNGGNVAAAAGSALLGSLGGVLIQLGELAIGVGVGIKAIQTALKSLNPVVAIAAGVALVALGSVFKSQASKIGGGKSSSSGVTAFADGGIISGPTLGLMGEYAGAKSDPEVVAPLSKLKRMLGQQDSAGNPISSGNIQQPIMFEHRVEIDGTKLVVLTDRIKAQQNRIS